MNLMYEIINREVFLRESGHHPKDSLIVLLEGEFQCRMEGDNFLAKENDVIVFNNQSYFERKVIKSLKAVYIQFDKFPSNLNDGIMRIPYAARLEESISFLEYAIKKEDHFLVKHFVKDIIVMSSYRKDDTVAKDKIVEECITTMNSQYHEKINLDNLAYQCSVSKPTLITRFKKNMGKTPIEYLNHIRINKSKTLLVNSNMFVGEIANECGFENIYYFSNIFKKSTGYSPQNYRNKFKL